MISSVSSRTIVRTVVFMNSIVGYSRPAAISAESLRGAVRSARPEPALLKLDQQCLVADFQSPGRLGPVPPDLGEHRVDGGALGLAGRALPDGAQSFARRDR